MPIAHLIVDPMIFMLQPVLASDKKPFANNISCTSAWFKKEKLSE